MKARIKFSLFARPKSCASGGILEFKHFAQKIEQNQSKICAKLFSQNP
jgi:hypothetical protein